MVVDVMVLVVLHAVPPSLSLSLYPSPSPAPVLRVLPLQPFGHLFHRPPLPFRAPAPSVASRRRRVSCVAAARSVALRRPALCPVPRTTLTLRGREAGGGARRVLDPGEVEVVVAPVDVLALLCSSAGRRQGSPASFLCVLPPGDQSTRRYKHQIHTDVDRIVTLKSH